MAQYCGTTYFTGLQNKIQMWLFFGPLKPKMWKFYKVSRPERFSTLFQCILFFFPDWAEVEKIGPIPSIETNLQCFNQVFIIPYDNTWRRGSFPGGQMVTSGTSRPEQTYFFRRWVNGQWAKIISLFRKISFMDRINDFSISY